MEQAPPPTALGTPPPPPVQSNAQLFRVYGFIWIAAILPALFASFLAVMGSDDPNINPVLSFILSVISLGPLVFAISAIVCFVYSFRRDIDSRPWSGSVFTWVPMGYLVAYGVLILALLVSLVWS